MGLNIREIVPKRELELSELRGKTVCVDAFNTLYQFLSTIRQGDGTPLMDNQRRVTSHLSGLFYRNLSLLSGGIRLIYVFDGVAPKLKGKIHKERKEIKEKAQEDYNRAKAKEDIFSMRKYGSQLSNLNDEMIMESKELLEAMGIMVVQAPGEGEAEAAYLSKNYKDIYASASQDYDSLLFGAKKLIQNLTLAKKRKTASGYVEVRPQVIDLEKILNQLEIGLEQLICLGILVGTDYNPKGIPGIGQKKALKLVQRFEQPVLIFKEVEEKIYSLPEEERFGWKEIFHLFKQYSTKDVKIDFPEIDNDKIREILIKRHDFSEKRVEKQLERLDKIQEENKQTGLKKWF
jgi:flap endonuclease-1